MSPSLGEGLLDLVAPITSSGAIQKSTLSLSKARRWDLALAEEIAALSHKSTTAGTSASSGKEPQRLNPTPGTRREGISASSRPSRNSPLPATCKRAAL